MGRPKASIKPKPAERLKQVLQETGITSLELSDRIGVTPQTISKIKNGRAGMTDYIAGLINQVFPQYSIAWLLGHSDSKNWKDSFIRSYNRAAIEWDSMLSAFILFAQLYDYTITLPDTSGNKTIEEIFAAINSGYSLTKDGKTVQFSIKEMHDLVNLVSETANMQIEYVFNAKQEV